jgi:hypothetical protein
LKDYLKSITRKAWWLIVFSTIYLLAALYWFVCDIQSGKFGKGGMIDTHLMQWQIVWLVVSALPLVIRPLGDWVFQRNRK